MFVMPSMRFELAISGMCLVFVRIAVDCTIVYRLMSSLIVLYFVMSLSFVYYKKNLTTKMILYILKFFRLLNVNHIKYLEISDLRILKVYK